MTAQDRPDEMIRILRAEFVNKAGLIGGGGGACVTFTCAATGWRAAGGTSTVKTLVHETAFQLDTGGNSRGISAVDLQQLRSAADEVAAGDYSAIIAGYYNKITSGGSFGAIVGGHDNEIQGGSVTPSNNCVIVGGTGNVIGILCLSSSVIGAEDSEVLASTHFSVTMGDTAQAVWGNSFVQGVVIATGLPGAAQTEIITRALNATLTSTWSNIGDFLITRGNTYRSWVFRARIIGTNQNHSMTWAYEIVGVMENANGSVTLLTSTTTALYEDDSNFDARAFVDDAVNRFYIQVQDTGSSGFQTRWSCTLELTQVIYV